VASGKQRGLIEDSRLGEPSRTIASFGTIARELRDNLSSTIGRSSTPDGFLSGSGRGSPSLDHGDRIKKVLR
jgi:hypothetical protein